jgi:hypothetical protein
MGVLVLALRQLLAVGGQVGGDGDFVAGHFQLVGRDVVRFDELGQVD